MSYSPEFKINVNKMNADEALYVLLEISHPFLTNPVRVINDSRDFVFLDETFVAMPFMIKRQSDVQGELPKVTLSISNVGRSLVKWIDSTGGGKNATLRVILARRSAQIIEEELIFGISSVSISTQLVTFNLIIQNNLTKRAIRWTYDTVHAPGLF